MFFKVGDWVNLCLHRGYKIPGLENKKIGQQFVGPFRVIERIGKLAYRLDLPGNMKIHNVISIAHLEPATNPTEDPYGRHRQEPPAVVVDGQDEWEIERIIRKRRIRRGRGWSTQYLIQWLGYGPEYNEWKTARDMGNAQELIADFEARENQDAEAALASDASSS